MSNPVQVRDKKHLEIVLSRICCFRNLKQRLEQYSTPSDLAAYLLWKAYISGDLHEKILADFGAGTGILAIGSAILGAKMVYAVEIDRDAIEIMQKNIDMYPVKEKIKIIKSDVANFGTQVDTVIMNPPFGTWQRRADRVFLDSAIRCADTVYSIHKYTDQFISWLNSVLPCEWQMCWSEIRDFPIPRSYAHHKKKVYKVKVILLKIERR